MSDDNVENTAGDLEEELYALVSITQLRNKKDASLDVSTDICTIYGVDCSPPTFSTAPGDCD